MQSIQISDSKSQSAKISDSSTLAKGAAVNLLGTLAKISRSGFTFFVTRVFGPQVFGLFTLATAIIDLVSRFTILGMDKSLLKFIPEVNNEQAGHRHKIISSTLIVALTLGFIFTTGLLVMAPWISKTGFKKPELTLPLQIIVFSILPVTLFNLLLSATKALKIMVYDAVISGMIYPLLLLLFSIPVIWVNRAEIGLCAAYTVTSFTIMLAAVWCFRKHFVLSQSLSLPQKNLLLRIIHFSTPLGLHDFVQYLVIKLEIFILAYFVTAKELGIYVLAVELAFILKKFRQMFDPILIPLISEFQSQGERQRVQENVARVIRWILTLGILYVGPIILFNNSILNLFGKEFTQGGICLVILCLAHLINANTGLCDLVMMVSNRPRINLLNAIVLLVLQAGLDIWLIPEFGILGAAIGASVSLVTLGLIRLLQSFFILKMNPFHISQNKPILAGLIAAAITLLARQLYQPFATASFLWIGNLILYVATYLVTLKLLGLEEEDRELLNRVFKRKGVPGTS